MNGDAAQGLKARLVKQALAEGFAKCRVTRLDAIPQAAGRLEEFVAAGRHGQMGWMAERMGWRGNPAALWPEARSVVMLAEVYTPEFDPLELLARRDRAAISVYAMNRDYHDVVKKRLKRLARWFLEAAAEGDGAPDVGGEKTHRAPLSSNSANSTAAHSEPYRQEPALKVFVDTAPVMEKPLAAAAGLGWQGKHTNLLARDLGSWFFLGAIFTTVELPVDAPEPEQCGSCTACLDICPTAAFPAPFQLDARRCISYLTIEHKGPVEEALRPLLGNRIYGCDDCLAVCPWNKFAAVASEIRYQARPELVSPPLADLALLDDAAFRALFSGSAIKRIGRDRFVRNVLYAIGNSGQPELATVAGTLLEDPDAAVADAARWACAQLTQD
jgi:epoxyqueuosine reductase